MGGEERDGGGTVDAQAVTYLVSGALVGLWDRYRFERSGPILVKGSRQPW